MTGRDFLMMSEEGAGRSRDKKKMKDDPSVHKGILRS